jgi:HK97 family phage portal protein
MSTMSLAERLFAPRAADPAMDERFWSAHSIGAMSAAGVRVSPESALRVSAVYRCLSILANTAALLPGGVFKRLERGRQEVPDHELRRVLWRRPNPYQRPFEFKRVMTAWAVLRGSAYARIYRRNGELELWPLHPDRVEGPELLESGRRRYKYTPPNGQPPEPLLADVDIVVLNGLSLDGMRGLAMSDLGRDTIGLASATEQYGATMFSRGARFSGVIKLPKGVTIKNPQAREELSRSVLKDGAGPSGWHGAPVFDDGAEWQQVSMSNDDAQFLETRKFSVTEIARWFGVPPHLAFDVERSTSWGTGIEQQSIEFVTYGLMPIIRQLEETMDGTFLADPSLYTRFNVEGLLRADADTRFRIYDMAIRNGIYSPNECRELEDRNPREGGDVYVTPTAPQQARGASPQPKPAAEPEADDPEGEAAALAARMVAVAPELAAEGGRKRHLETLRTSAAALGVPQDAVRKLLAHAKAKE